MYLEESSSGFLPVGLAAARIFSFNRSTTGAPIITAGIVEADHDLDPELSVLMLGIGIPFSFLTLPVWYWFLLL